MSKPIYASICGKVYDVSMGHDFYFSSDYTLLMECEASSALVKMPKESDEVRPSWSVVIVE
jgi:hypothetical protein